MFFPALQKTLCVPKEVGFTWGAGDAIGSLRWHLRGSGRRIPAGSCREVIWPPLTARSCNASSTPRSPCECFFRYLFTTLHITSPSPCLCTCLCRKTTVWVWVKRKADGSEQAVDTDPVGSSRWPKSGTSHGGCVQMALGTPGQWRKAPCSGRHVFLCENTVTGTPLTHWSQIFRSDIQETVK